MRFTLAFLLLCVISTPVAAVKTIKWDRSVIAVKLIVGIEQMITFEGAASVGVPESLISQDMFRHMFASETAYWKAMVPFDSQRISVRLEKTGEYLLFDVSAVSLKKPPKKVESLNIVRERRSADDTETTRNESLMSSAVPSKRDATMFDLVRYAAQHDYAPPRLIKGLDGVRELDNKFDQSLSALYRHPDAQYLELSVTRQFTVDGWYVTAVEVHNNATFPITVDPSLMQHTARDVVNGLNNQFIASAMVVRRLTEHGGGLDRTMMYVVTERPPSQVIDLQGAFD